VTESEEVGDKQRRTELKERRNDGNRKWYGTENSLYI
jgi:hypothetical protein